MTYARLIAVIATQPRGASARAWMPIGFVPAPGLVA